MVSVPPKSSILKSLHGTSARDLAVAATRYSRPTDRRLDLPVRLVGRDEDLVGVLEIERRQIHQQVMLVRHHQANPVQFGYGFEGGLRHLEQRSLHRRAVARGKNLEHRLERRAVRLGAARRKAREMPG